ncbi:MAG: hypothetical protein KZQ83_11905 [gamma proteobacterium symbiont of Taylorina sp.]|nr:hypothetical protein [gamma proteobacterium symbiont of Taylorina sp.]
MSDAPIYNLDCQKCQIQYKLDDVAFDKSCQNKHIFLFICPKCGDYKGTAMANIPQLQWQEFVPAEQLPELLQQYKEAMKSH